MARMPIFRIFGEGDTPDEKAMQPGLELRDWNAVTEAEKRIILQELENTIEQMDLGQRVLRAVRYLNKRYLHLQPGNALHKEEMRAHSDYDLIQFAMQDLRNIIIRDERRLALTLLDAIAQTFISRQYYKLAEAAADDGAALELTEKAFQSFDDFAKIINYIFYQFRVNLIMTREGTMPRQDDAITRTLYIPTLAILSAPKWRRVSSDLGSAFDHYHDNAYSETITQAHSAVQRFLQTLLGWEEGKNGRGEFGDLWKATEKANIIPENLFVRKVLDAFKSYIPQERATNSSAKPSTRKATAEEALLMLNVTMTLIQFCLAQGPGGARAR